MIEIIGVNTGKVYEKGYRSDCFRRLQDKYPSSTDGKNHRNRRNINNIYPEPLQVKRIPKYIRRKNNVDFT